MTLILIPVLLLSFCTIGLLEFSGDKERTLKKQNLNVRVKA